MHNFIYWCKVCLEMPSKPVTRFLKKTWEPPEKTGGKNFNFICKAHLCFENIIITFKVVFRQGSDKEELFAS